jgi:hypothetical protein
LDSQGKFFNVSELPNCLKAYGLDQQRENNIGIVKSSRSKIKLLAYQLEQGGHLRITKEEL